MLTARILPPEEWSKLAGTELEAVFPLMRPAHTKVLVIENETGAIVGCWGLFSVLHCEGVWVAPGCRGRSTVPRALLREMRRLIAAEGAEAVITASVDPAVSQMLETLGATELPGTHYLWMQQRRSNRSAA